MRPFLITGAILAVSLGGIGCSGNPSASSLPQALGPASSTSTANVHPMSARAMPIGQSIALCAAGKAAKGSASCSGMQRTDIKPISNPYPPISSIPGLAPSDLRTAYGLSTAAGGAGQKVAVVVAYDAPSLESDLAVYRKEFNLPACSSASGCLTFAYANKQKPSKDPYWSAEAELDVQMVSAVCPKCSIIVAEAKSAKLSDLAAAVGTAVSAGATEVSNSYSLPEDSSDSQYESAFNVPGVPMTAGAGDGGYGPGYPASSQYVTAVGGTSLLMSRGAVISEAVWGSSGSGCSQVNAKPYWQTDAGCTNRTVNDVAVVADPNGGVATYVSSLGGWNIFGGTSIGAPIVASMYALAGNGRTISNASRLYNNASQFHSIQGSTGACSPSYLCNGSVGYNGPAGLGTPYGLTAF